jgi:hypothetical protein
VATANRYFSAKQSAEKVKEAASGVKIPDDKLSFMSKLKLRPLKSRLFPQAVKPQAGARLMSEPKAKTHKDRKVATEALERHAAIELNFT